MRKGFAQNPVYAIAPAGVRFAYECSALTLYAAGVCIVRRAADVENLIDYILNFHPKMVILTRPPYGRMGSMCGAQVRGRAPAQDHGT